MSAKPVRLSPQQRLVLEVARRKGLDRVAHGWEGDGKHFSGVCVNSLIRRGLLAQIGGSDDQGRPKAVAVTVEGLRVLRLLAGGGR